MGKGVAFYVPDDWILQEVKGGDSVRVHYATRIVSIVVNVSLVVIGRGCVEISRLGWGERRDGGGVLFRGMRTVADGGGVLF